MDIIGMIDIRRWRDRWELWKQHRQRLIHCQRMRSDYLKIAGITPGIAALLDERRSETVNVEPKRGGDSWQ